jgi:L-threonylcarbamoyladenylate synthase
MAIWLWRPAHIVLVNVLVTVFDEVDHGMRQAPMSTVIGLIADGLSKPGAGGGMVTMERHMRAGYLRVTPETMSEVVHEAVAVLRQGGVVAYPTDTVYGLAVDAMDVGAIVRLYDVKGRPDAKALPLIIGDVGQLAEVAAVVPPQAEKLMAAFWPGPLTLLFEPHEALPVQLRGGSPRIGVRWPAAMLSQQLARELGHAITATSANRSSAPAALTAEEVARQLGSSVDLILDGGRAESTEVSTVLDVVMTPPGIRRAGKISSLAIEASLRMWGLPGPT